MIVHNREQTPVKTVYTENNVNSISYGGPLPLFSQHDDQSYYLYVSKWCFAWVIGGGLALHLLSRKKLATKQPCLTCHSGSFGPQTASSLILSNRIVCFVYQHFLQSVLSVFPSFCAGDSLNIGHFLQGGQRQMTVPPSKQQHKKYKTSTNLFLILMLTF